MAQFKFDPTVNLGHLLTFGGMIAAGMTAYFNLKGDLSVMDQRLRSVETYMVKMTDLLVGDARQDTRLSGLEKRVDRLEGLPLRRLEGEASR